MSLLRRRWRIIVLGGLVLVVAGLWAVFPSLLGGAPTALDSEEATVAAVSCENCPFFDLDSVQVPGNGLATFSLAEYQQALDDGAAPTWVVPTHAAPEIAFTVGNATPDAEILLTGIELEIRDHEPVPEGTNVGCIPPDGGSMSTNESVEPIGFTVAVSPELVGATQAVSVDEGSAQVSIQPSGLERYEGELSLAEPGIYTLGVKAAYDSSEGVTSSVSSADIHVMWIDWDRDVTMVTADRAPVCETVTFPAPGPSKQLVDVAVQNGAVGFRFADQVPAVRIERIERPVVERPSGRELEIQGSGLLAVTMAPSSRFDLSGSPERTYDGPRRIGPNDETIAEIVLTEDAEGMMTWAIGTAAPDPTFRFSIDGRTVWVRLDG